MNVYVLLTALMMSCLAWVALNAAPVFAEGVDTPQQVEWLVVGPFPMGEGQSWRDRDYLEDAGGAERVRPAVDQVAGGKQWQRVVTGPTINLVQAIGAQKNVVAYASRTIDHPTGGLAAIRFRNDDTAKIYVNGQYLGVFGIGERVRAVQLRAGENRILAKVQQGGGGWVFGAQLDDVVRTNVGTFSPNGDGVNEQVEVFLAVDRPRPATVRVLDQSGSVLRSVIDGKTVRNVNDAVLWDGRDDRGRVVPDGTYTIQASIDGSRPAQTTVQVRTTLVLKERGFEHLKRWFPTGVFYDGNKLPRDPEQFRAQCRDLRQHHMGMIVLVNTWLERDSLLDASGRNWMLDIAAQEGIRVLMPVKHGPRSAFLRGETDATEYDAINPIRDLVSDMDSYPAVAGYLTADEPRAELANRLHVASRVFAHIDDQRPAFPVIVGLDRTWVHQRTAGYPVLFIDPYAASFGRDEGDFTMSGFGYPHLDLGEYIDFARHTAGTEAQLWTLLQTHNFSTQLREPTADEVRAMSWIALAHGSKGLFYFVYQSQQGWRGLVHEGQPTDRYQAAAEVAELVSGPLGELLLKLEHSPTPAAVTDGNQPTDVQTFRHTQTGETYLIVVNKDVKRKGAARLRLMDPRLEARDIVRQRQPVTISDDTILVPWQKHGEGTVLHLVPRQP